MKIELILRLIMLIIWLASMITAAVITFKPEQYAAVIAMVISTAIIMCAIFGD